MVTAVQRQVGWLSVFVVVGCSALNNAASPLEAEQHSVAAGEGRVPSTRRIHVGVGGVLLDGLAVPTVGLGNQIRQGDQVALSADQGVLFGSVNGVLSELLAAGRLVIRATLGGTVQDVELGKGYLDPSRAPGLLVMVVNGGISLKGPGGNVAPGCAGLGDGVAIPRTIDAQDYSAASACISRIKAITGVARYHVAADTKIPFREVDATVSALNSGGGQLVGVRVF